MNTIIKGVVLSKVCSIKPDGDSTESKQINLSVNFDGTTLQGVFDKALSSTVISWQNTVGRKHFDEYKSGQVVKVEFKSPGRTTVDPETAIKGKLAGMTADEREEYIKTLLAGIEE